MKKRYWFIFSAILSISAVLAAVFVFRPVPHVFNGTLIDPPIPLSEFSFPIAANTQIKNLPGERISNADLKGKYVLFFFGYTFCPGMGPDTFSEVIKAFRILGDEKASRIQMVMVSVDPKRDSPEKMAEYAAFYDPRFLGLTGSPEEIARVAQLFNISYEVVEGSSETEYAINHTATLTLVDPLGNIREVFEFGTPGKAIAADLNYWLK